MIDTLLQTGIAILMGAILLALFRMVRGPTVVDRILAFDTITVCVVGLIILLSMVWKTGYFLELILVVSLLGFLSGAAFVFYLDRTLDKHPEDNHPARPSDPGSPGPRL